MTAVNNLTSTYMQNSATSVEQKTGDTASSQQLASPTNKQQDTSTVKTSSPSVIVSLSSGVKQQESLTYDATGSTNVIGSGGGIGKPPP